MMTMLTSVTKVTVYTPEEAMDTDLHVEVLAVVEE
jgi:hypothetical protein